ncbi:SRPBCC domain-containing protein [Heyndrickxia sp. NPDC080065]|uniref:SRPBCC family protein n=1 Tax=Heyndrickxia sp. NPDC080065 TaxID=3390568 RepID=UPI003D01068D
MTTYHSAKKDIFINVPVEKVWKALTVPSQRNKWETKQCEINLAIGGKIDLDYGWGVTYSGIITEIKENEKLVIEGSDKGLTIWTITPQDGGSLVSIEYTGLWSDDIGIMEMENMMFGTYQFMKNFKSVLEKNIDIRHTFWASWIGVLHRTHPSKSGVEVVKIISHTPADGIIQVGDIIQSLNGQTIHNYDDFETQITQMGPDKEITLDIQRQNHHCTINITTIPYGTKLQH